MNGRDRAFIRSLVHRTKDRICVHCARPFRAKRASDRPRYCSEACREATRKARYREQNLAEAPKKLIRCYGCHKVRKPRNFYRDLNTKRGYGRTCKTCLASPSVKQQQKVRAARWTQRLRDTDPQRYLWREAQQRAKKTGVAFTIRVEDVRIPERCPVLGIPLFFGNRGNPNSPSLDRLEPSGGYTPSNVRVISFRANSLKHNATLEELRAIYRYVQAQLRRKDGDGK